MEKYVYFPQYYGKIKEVKQKKGEFLNMGYVVPVAIFVFAILIFIIYMTGRYRRCPSDKILVIFGPSSFFPAPPS